MTKGDEDLASLIAKVEYDIDTTELPEYFRNLSKVDWKAWENWTEDFKDGLSNVLKNNLVYCWSGVEAGSGDYEEYFFCATVDDVDLPWDRTQIDW